MDVYDYESLSRLFEASAKTPVLEAYRGKAVVRWHAQIKRAVMDFIKRYAAARNTEYVRKLEAFLSKWTDSELDGSINQETVRELLALVSQPAVDSWDLQSFFMEVETSLKELMAVEFVELPRIPDYQSPKTRKGAPREFGAEKVPGETPGAPPSEEAGIGADIEAAVDAGVNQPR